MVEGSFGGSWTGKSMFSVFAASNADCDEIGAEVGAAVPWTASVGFGLVDGGVVDGVKGPAGIVAASSA